MYLVEITKATRAEDLHVEIDSLVEAILYLAQNGFGPDGHRLIEYQEASGDQVPGDAILLRTRSGSVAFASVAAALAAAPMNAAEPYEIINEPPKNPDGSSVSGSTVIRRRVSLFDTDYQEQGGFTGGGTLIGCRANEHGRTDPDRF